MSTLHSDQYWMEAALEYAKEAEKLNEIPVGAIIVKDNQLVAYKHESFWHPMDTLRDKRYLERISNGNKSPWLVD